ncbi:MAG: IS200/IS605 family transposase [Pseudomonadota bacterium]
MTNTFSALHYHFIFSTKNRVPYLSQNIEKQIWQYMAGIARYNKIIAIKIGGFDDHIHALVKAPTNIAPSQIAQYLKANSSKWIHQNFLFLKDFAWQEGYAVFTVNKINCFRIVKYIERQRQHHSNKKFEDEYLDFLKINHINYDEKYLFD